MSHTGCVHFIHAFSRIHTHTSDDITFALCVVRDRRRTGDRIGHANNTSMERSAENQYKYLWISLLYTFIETGLKSVIARRGVF